MVDSGELTSSDSQPQEHHLRLAVPASLEKFDNRFTEWAWGLLKLDFTGIAFAAFFFCWSLTPSLLPRDWLFQGLIGGINSAIGYGVGTAIGWAVERYLLSGRRWWPLPEPVPSAIKVFVPVASIVAAIIMLVYAAGWQREIAALTDAEGTTTSG
ncbi:alpha/beta-hydrolase N-terminal domain-containing protein, partial [Rhodococcus erythropolis]|nr:alpha/beta-hydrolase N-terminal domain-containing protein [Rhodococcus erythropolis]